MPADSPTLTIARLGRVLEINTTSCLSVPQYRVLGALATGDERATQLAARLAVAKPTLTTLVDSLVERGYVARDTPDGDRRVVTLSITRSGRTALRTTAAQLRTAFDGVLDRCEYPDAVLVALEDLRQALDLRWADRMAEPPAPAATSRGKAVTR